MKHLKNFNNFCLEKVFRASKPKERKTNCQNCGGNEFRSINNIDKCLYCGTAYNEEPTETLSKNNISKSDSSLEQPRTTHSEPGESKYTYSGPTPKF